MTNGIVEVYGWLLDDPRIHALSGQIAKKVAHNYNYLSHVWVYQGNIRVRARLGTRYGGAPNLSQVHRSRSHEFQVQKRDSRVTDDRNTSSDGQYEAKLRIDNGEKAFLQEGASLLLVPATVHVPYGR